MPGKCIASIALTIYIYIFRLNNSFCYIFQIQSTSNILKKPMLSWMTSHLGSNGQCQKSRTSRQNLRFVQQYNVASNASGIPPVSLGKLNTKRQRQIASISHLMNNTPVSTTNIPNTNDSQICRDLCFNMIFFNSML